MITTMTEHDTIIVVPCYNEAQRLDRDAYQSFVSRTSGVDFVFVNDGSTDDTAAVLSALITCAPDRLSLINCERNRGKAEAVRIGMSYALTRARRYAGFWDADLATPLTEIPRFAATLDARPACEICFGARVKLLGRAIERRAYRHYGGRLFAAAASIVLQLPVYDTQCGAKLFRVSPHTVALFAEPFLGRWTFDVEIIARLKQELASSEHREAADAIYELPLDEWRDVRGSQVKSIDFVLGLVELARIRSRYFSARARRAAAISGSSQESCEAPVAPARRAP